MAIVNRTYFATDSYSASFDYDDQTFKLVAVYGTNSGDTELVIGLYWSENDELIKTYSFAPGSVDFQYELLPTDQLDLVLIPRGEVLKVGNVYAKTIN